jgi:hypothetical protein
MFDDIEFNIKEYPIKGKMVVVQFTLNLSEIEMLELQNGQIANNIIKESLCKSMVNVILENKLAEFTMLENPVDMSKKYRVRCFLVPDEDVRLIRKLYDVNQQPKHPTF